MNTRYSFAVALACVAAIGLAGAHGTEQLSELDSLLYADAATSYAELYPEQHARHLAQGIIINSMAKTCLPPTGVSSACDNLIRELRDNGLEDKDLAALNDSDASETAVSTSPAAEFEVLVEPMESDCMTGFSPNQRELACNCENPVVVVEKFMSMGICLRQAGLVDKRVALKKKLDTGELDQFEFIAAEQEVETNIERARVEIEIINDCKTDILIMDECNLDGVGIQRTAGHSGLSQSFGAKKPRVEMDEVDPMSAAATSSIAVAFGAVLFVFVNMLQ